MAVAYYTLEDMLYHNQYTPDLQLDTPLHTENSTVTHYHVILQLHLIKLLACSQLCSLLTIQLASYITNRSVAQILISKN